MSENRKLYLKKYFKQNRITRRFPCIYCNKSFRDGYVLKLHNNRKLHKKNVILFRRTEAFRNQLLVRRANLLASAIFYRNNP